jgi:hypothetical protein
MIDTVLHRHTASYRFSMASGGGRENGTCSCGVAVHRPIADGIAPRYNRNPWTLQDSEPLVSMEGIESAHVEALTMNESIDTTVHVLTRGDSTCLSGVAHLVFGQLMALAQPHVKFYHSDLYYDAQWCEKHIAGTEPISFNFSTDECGTNLGVNDYFLNRKYAYRITVRPELQANRLVTVMTVTRVATV